MGKLNDAVNLLIYALRANNSEVSWADLANLLADKLVNLGHVEAH